MLVTRHIATLFTLSQSDGEELKLGFITDLFSSTIQMMK